MLERIAETALDDDYYVYRGSQATPTWRTGVVAFMVVTVVAAFITTAAVQTRNDRPATELERRTLAADIEARQKILDQRRATAASLSAEVASLRQSGDPEQDRPADLGVLSSSASVNGPGIVITAESSKDGSDAGRITDRDLQILVNGLWYAGAEAVAINDNRVGTMTSIRTAGDAITVNYRSITSPYTVVALGDSDGLQTRLGQNPAGAYWESRRKRFGVEFAVTPSSEATLPAVPDQRLALKHASTLEEN